jgi:hypothetical protein
MARVVGRHFLAAAAATLVIAAACRDAQSPEPQASLLPGLPNVGAIVVSTVTSGSPVDPDGYTVTVDNGPPQHIAPTGVVTFTGLAVGNHTVTLSGVAANCSVNGTVTVNVPVLGSVSVTFTVRCAPNAPPSTGDLTVTTSTTGANLDPDGYTVTLDGSTNRAIATNGSVTFTGLPAGNHTVVLSGVAGNCSASGGTSRTVNVPAGGTASTSFAVSCAGAPPPTGTRVTGRGAIGAGSATPGSDRQEFDFEATDVPSGRLAATDYSVVRAAGSVGRMTVDPASDAATGMTSLSRTSAACVRFTGSGGWTPGSSFPSSQTSVTTAARGPDGTPSASPSRTAAGRVKTSFARGR